MEGPDTLPWIGGLVVMTLSVLLPLAYMVTKNRNAFAAGMRRGD